MASPVPNSPALSATSASAAPSSSTQATAINPATKKTVVTAGQAAKAKSMNVFQKFGLQHIRWLIFGTIQKMKEEEVEKKKQSDALARKQAFEQRIKNRGKRTATQASASDSETDSPNPTHNKKAKPDEGKEGGGSKDGAGGKEGDSAYLREVRRLQGHSLRDEGAGVRALVR